MRRLKKSMTYAWHGLVYAFTNGYNTVNLKVTLMLKGIDKSMPSVGHAFFESSHTLLG